MDIKLAQNPRTILIRPVILVCNVAQRQLAIAVIVHTICFDYYFVLLAKVELDSKLAQRS